MKKEEVNALLENGLDFDFSVKEFMEEATIEVQKEHLLALLCFLKEKCNFTVLTDLTGVDYLLPSPHTKVVYFLQNPENYQRVKVVSSLQRKELLDSIVHLWDCAEWFERELYDLFGVQLLGHFEMKRLLMPDNWVGHPLRKDYSLTEEPVEFKHGVQPKIPSKIIPSFGVENG